MTQCIYLLIEEASIAADERGNHFEALPWHYPCLLHQVIERPGVVVPLLGVVSGVMVAVVAVVVVAAVYVCGDRGYGSES